MSANKDVFPPIISSLPKTVIPIDGLEAYLIQGHNQQIVFMAFAKDVDVPAHNHKAQWGVVLSGEIELTIEGESKIYRKGDSYYIHDGATHSAIKIRGTPKIRQFGQFAIRGTPYLIIDNNDYV